MQKSLLRTQSVPSSVVGSKASERIRMVLVLWKITPLHRRRHRNRDGGAGMESAQGAMEAQRRAS